MVGCVLDGALAGWSSEAGTARAARANTIIHWTEFDRGGHFAALEEPELLVRDVRDFFRGLRG